MNPVGYWQGVSERERVVRTRTAIQRTARANNLNHRWSEQSSSASTLQLALARRWMDGCVQRVYRRRPEHFSTTTTIITSSMLQRWLAMMEAWRVGLSMDGWKGRLLLEQPLARLLDYQFKFRANNDSRLDVVLVSSSSASFDHHRQLIIEC